MASKRSFSSLMMMTLDDFEVTRFSSFAPLMPAFVMILKVVWIGRLRKAETRN